MTSPSIQPSDSPSAQAPKALPHSIAMLAPGENAPEDTGSGAASLSSPRQRRQPRRRGLDPQTTILIVDDEEPVREALVEVLSTQGYHVLTAANVEQAEATKTRLGSEGIQLLITDVNLLPGPQARAGYALAQRWRAMHPELPIILISGDPNNEDLPEVRGGLLGFLLKPFRMNTLIEAVQRALGR